MAREVKLTIEQKKAICEEYKDHSINVNEIAERYGLSRGEVAHIAVELGAEPRRAKVYGGSRKKRTATVRACPKCRKIINVKGAKFCCFCGEDIRNNKELLIERVSKAMATIKFIPESLRDETQILFMDIIEELSKED